MKKLFYLLLLICTSLYAEGMEAPWQGSNIEEPANVLWHALRDYTPPLEKPIVLIITVFNNKPWIEVVLDSVFAQKYENYRLIIITDKPTDGCDQAMEEYIKKCGQEHRVTFIKNTEWKSQLANHYTAGHLCDDDEIMINLDCDDCFKHEYVFALINKIYSFYSHICCTYGGSEYWPQSFSPTTNTPIPDRVIAAGNFRQAQSDDKFSWVWWHPRTFYAWVFKQVKLQDLLHHSSFKPLAPSPDSAFMYPILEMLRGKTLQECHVMHIPDILYVWNMRNPLSQWCSSGTKQLDVNRLVASWEQYPVLAEIPVHRMEQFHNSKATVLMIPESAAHAFALINSVYKYAHNINELYLLYQADELLLKREYEALAVMFPKVHFMGLKAQRARNVLMDIADEHILVLSHTPLQRAVDLNWAIKELERTFAHAFFVHITKDISADYGITEYAPVTDQLGAWQFKYAQGAAHNAYALDGVLYRKSDMNLILADCPYTTIDTLEKTWTALNDYPNLLGRKVGLFMQ